MIAALIASIAANVAFAYLLTRQVDAARADARAADQAHAREVANLCQRIQAPDVAVQQHAIETQPIETPRPDSLFDDEDHWDARPTVPKEKLAEMLMDEELAHA